MNAFRRQNWLMYVFVAYGVPALLMFAVLPTYHAQGCACWRSGHPMVRIYQPRLCAACVFSLTTPLSGPVPVERGLVRAAVCRHDAAPLVTASHTLFLSTVRAHSPPVA